MAKQGKIKETDPFNGPILVKELNDLWSSMNDLTELCKLISERVDVLGGQVQTISSRVTDLECNDK